GLGHIMATLEVLKNYHVEENLGTATVLREQVGVIGMITPWNWPLNQIACKVAPALADGCTMILKPSEFTPTSALIFAEILHEAGVPKGVFNLVNGLGPEVGAAMSEHPDIDMISFTGSTRAGVDVAKRAAPTVKRVSQELGGKSPNVILDDADLAKAVTGGPGLPEGVNKGFYVRPTIFADVTNDMTIAREEIFGPVLTILGAKDEADAVKIANDTPYGLAGYVSAGSVERARKVGRQI